MAKLKLYFENKNKKPLNFITILINIICHCTNLARNRYVFVRPIITVEAITTLIMEQHFYLGFN